jgi:uncharacterized protein YggE
MTGVQRTLVAAAVTIGCGAGVYALGTTQAHGSPQTVLTSGTAPAGAGTSGVTVTGTGNATGTPDELQLSMEVDTQASSAGAALDQANKDMSRVRETFRAQGVADADLRTSGLSVQANYGPSQQVTGYQVTESLTAVLHDVGKAGQVITAVSSAAGNSIRIDGVSLDLSDPTSTLLASARSAAMTDARARAQQYANAAGRPLGQVVSISEVATPGEVPMPYASSGAGMSNAASVPIASGTQKVTVTVTVTYALG